MNKSYSNIFECNNFTLYQGLCEEIIPTLNNIDAVICDLPYGTTRCAWDTPINLDNMWGQLKNVVKKDGAIILTAQTPFDKVLGSSNLSMLRYELIWEKTAATGHLNAKRMPMKAHENILVFYKNMPTYNPQMTLGHKPVNKYTKHGSDGPCYGSTKIGISGGGSTERYPRSVLKFASDKQKTSLHPTQKPLALIEYLIKTYTNVGDTVLDFTMGSGTTGHACVNLDRKFIGIEKDYGFYQKAFSRISSANIKKINSKGETT